MERPEVQTVELRLNQPEEMFVLAQTDLFSEYRNYLTGVEYCLSVLRSGPRHGPVRLDISLPAAEVDDGVAERMQGALRRYCEYRITYNQRERRAVRLDGLSSLWVGVPIVVLGYLMVIFAGPLVGRTGNTNLVFDSTGWVFVWVGIWFPLDTLLFTPLAYGRENRVLRALLGARISIVGGRPNMAP